MSFFLLPYSTPHHKPNMEHIWSLLFALFISALSFIISKLLLSRPAKNLPPGPKPWPIIGNLNLLGPIPHQSLHSLSQKYGQLMLLKFGNSPVIVASSPDSAKLFLKTHDTIFASRPPLAAGKYTSYNYSDMTWAPYGPYWRQARRIYMSEVFTSKRLDSSHHIRAEERRHLTARLFSLSGRPVVLRDQLGHHTLSTICRMVLSDKYFDDDRSSDELKRMLDEWFFLGGAFNVGDWIKWLDFLDLQGYKKRMKAFAEKMDEFLTHVVDDHSKKKDHRKQDMVDVLVERAEDPSLDVKMTSDRVKGLLLNLLAGGTDTSATTVEWIVHEILRHPSVMERAKDEIDRVIGVARWVEEDDFPRLPYVEAVIMETLRLHPLATLLAPHYAIEDCQVAGYEISKGTMVLINTWSIGRDPEVWDQPERFWPERFLGKETTDMLGSNFGLLPFGSGRRRCPGYSLGLKIVRTTLANLIHGFDMRLEEGMEVCMEEEYGLTTHPKKPLSIIMEPTLPTHLY